MTSVSICQVTQNTEAVRLQNKQDSENTLADVQTRYASLHMINIASSNKYNKY